MTFSYLLLFIGVVVLWLPRGWLRRGRPEGASRRGGGSRGAPRRERLPGDQSLWITEEFTKRRNWVDFARGLAGGFAVGGALADLTPEAWRPLEGPPGLWPLAAICAVGVLLQAVRWEGRLVLYPPIFYICGLAFALIGWKAALFSFVTIWAVNLVMPSPGVFLFTYAGISLILGLLFGAGPHGTSLLAALALVPPFLAVVTKRRLAQFSKRTKVVIR